MLFLLTLACEPHSTTVPSTTGDTGQATAETGTARPSVGDVRVECYSGPSIEASVGTATRAVWDIMQGVVPTPYMEEHPLEVVDGTASILLTERADPAIPGEASGYDCGMHFQPGDLTFALRIYDGAGLADCVVWGARPEMLMAATDLAPESVGLTALGELAGCRVGL